MIVDFYRLEIVFEITRFHLMTGNYYGSNVIRQLKIVLQTRNDTSGGR